MAVNEQDKIKELCGIIDAALKKQILKKAIFSKYTDKAVLRTEARLVRVGDGTVLQTEQKFSDGKVKHRNLDLECAVNTLSLEADLCGQINIITTAGECECKRSKKGAIFINNRIRSDAATQTADIGSHNKEKNYILREGEKYPFLELLGICDAAGRVYDKKQAKFRQINKFLEIIADVYPAMPAEGTLCVYDLCCGKSYLTFAVYHYLTEICGRSVKMYGIDLKADVIKKCADIALKLGYGGLEFSCGNINTVNADIRPDLVVSLHACDIATDIVLDNSTRWQAGIILSSPCCQHEIYGQITKENLGMFAPYPILSQKLCALMTDALRCQWLDAKGYDTSAIEFIDPDETPKNVLIKAVRRKTADSDEKRKIKEERYLEKCRKYGIDPYLAKKL